jgi:hypothetical protein
MSFPSIKKTYMRRDTSLRLRVCSVTYVYVRALADTRRASSRSHLRLFVNDVYASRYVVAAPCLLGYARQCTRPRRYSPCLVSLASSPFTPFQTSKNYIQIRKRIRSNVGLKNKRKDVRLPPSSRLARISAILPLLNKYDKD